MTTLYTVIERDEYGLWWPQVTTANVNEANAFLTIQVTQGFGDPVTHYRVLTCPEGYINRTIELWHALPTLPDGITWSFDQIKALLEKHSG